MPDEDIRLSGIDSRLSRIEGIIEQIDKRLSNVESRFNNSLDNNLDNSLNCRFVCIDKIDHIRRATTIWLLGLILPLYGLILFDIITK